MQQQRLRVYAWEFPVRFTHWISFLSIIALSITGFYIGNPFIHAISSRQYIMGWMRFIHFTAAYTFLFSFLIRIYWAFMGNKYASWRVWFPFTSRRWKDLVEAAKFYSFLGKKPPYAVGHTAFAGITYFIVFLLSAFEMLTGFAVYSQNHQGLIWALLGGWMLSIFEVQTLRLLHHLVMYVFIAFSFLHVYIAWWLDTVEKNGLIGSIFGGYKFVTGKEWE
ncbi:MAG: Ni/Fe-hydrogenase, b-type cytochrome subunit [Nitrospirae bacterium]|nr:Ni/Fe-hydrogenase, b-type cytochrome subunit [Nitrospirota bacterium]